jgi:hypothetical protein
VFLCDSNIQGHPQYIRLSFKDNVIPKRLTITFQGGFVGLRCAVRLSDNEDDEAITTIYPKDANLQQVFDLPQSHPRITEGISLLKLVFEESSDFFGRIIVYDLKIEGIKGPRIGSTRTSEDECIGMTNTD